MLRRIGAALRSTDSPTVLVECRHCGQIVDPDALACDACGRTEFAHYGLS